MMESEMRWDGSEPAFADGGHLFEEEVAFDCPSCGEPITTLLDLSISRQSFIEDCEVCCRPFVLSFSVRDGIVEDLTVRTEDDI